MNGVNFVERIDSVLKTKGLTRTPMLKALGLSSAACPGWISRGNLPAGDVCLRIARYLNVSVEWLISGEDSQSPAINPEELQILEGYKKLDARDQQDLKDFLTVKLSHYSDSALKNSFIG